MGGESVDIASNRVSADDAAHLLIFNPWVTLLGQSAYAIVIALIYWLYRPIVPAGDMRIWAVIAGTVIAFAILVNIAFAIRRPGSAELLRIWRAIDKRTPMLFDLVAALAILLLFPHGSADMQLISVAFCVGYVPLQMVSDPENTFGNRFSIIAVLGSYTVWLFLHGETTQIVLGVMMIAYGTVLFIAADVFRSVVVAAVAARAESEANAQALGFALKQVSAERDAKTRFIAAASHDLGQPLQAANLFAENLVVARNAPERERAAGGVKRAIASAQALIGNMLNHMRLEADAVVPNVQTIHLAEALAASSNQFALQAKAANIRIRSVRSSMEFLADPSLLDRAIGNLVQNAIAHSDATRILLGAKRVRPGWMRIYVVDDGAGVPAEAVAKIFDDYVQGANTRASARGGFGLGLASARRIATLLGGHAGIDPRWRNGAAFYLELPELNRRAR